MMNLGRILKRDNYRYLAISGICFLDDTMILNKSFERSVKHSVKYIARNKR
jgi:hypothetical protein